MYVYVLSLVKPYLTDYTSGFTPEVSASVGPKMDVDRDGCGVPGLWIDFGSGFEFHHAHSGSNNSGNWCSVPVLNRHICV
ncbi:hypothetical protein SARC_16169 [Sphaeroforma arctica JP610]|uniref:Uncharacterized protein n=1 Tax=Sphaeroforma arctica JP610 TaxID=667725 RepID=A0A0L0F3I6_9EUKA|nr:hypothetical protein SARC_16169 [Sphaeroforma arctica JP610]KNC71295.1 hypothetical protein SARC_16169 [Sphaeroforma arctica JP610]|eukprot:XP_014145197.1 hypothetical protein SARC_16169 [Sphaeroforma arctica JP610]